MKIKAKAKALSEIMKTVTRAAATRSTMPVLGCVLFEAKGGVLTVSATDTEISVKISCAAPMEEEGAAAISARLLSDVVRSLPQDVQVSLEATEKGATLTSPAGVYTMRVYPEGDFPRVAPFPREAFEAFALPVATLDEGVEKVAVATANDEKRPVLGGVSASVGAGRLRLVATDSYRLALYEAAVDKESREEQTALIPARALREAVRLSAGVENVEVALTENVACFRTGPIELTTRLIAGNFPDYNKLLPESFEKSYEVDAQALLDTLARVNLFAAGQSPPVPVKLAFDKSDGPEGGELTVAVKSAEIGEATEKIGARLENEDEAYYYAVAFNGSYLADGLRVSGGAGPVVLKFNDPMKPAVISAIPTADEQKNGTSGAGADRKSNAGHKPDKELLYLIMPMRDPDAG